MTEAPKTHRSADEGIGAGPGSASGPGAPPFEVAYQGRPGAFGESAARTAGGAGAVPLPCPTFEAVVDALADGQVRRAVLPVVNAVAGGVGEALDLVATRTGTWVVGAVTVPVAMALIAPPGVGVGAIRRVRSHPVALAQCRAFFRAHPHIEPVADFDTAGAVEAVVAAGRGDEAALGSVRSAREYGGCVLRAPVQDHPRNATRFLVLARAAEAAPDAWTAAAPRHVLAVWTGADAGLADVLARLRISGWRLAHLERRPGAGSDGGDGRFVLDLEREPATDRGQGPDGSARSVSEEAALERAVPRLVVRGGYEDRLWADADGG